MSWQSVQSVLHHSEARGGARLVMIAIAEQINKEGLAWPSIETLSKHAKVEPRGVRRLIVALEESGELVVRRAKGRPNVYSITLCTKGAGTPSSTEPTKGAGTRGAGTPGVQAPGVQAPPTQGAGTPPPRVQAPPEPLRTIKNHKTKRQKAIVDLNFDSFDWPLAHADHAPLRAAWADWTADRRERGKSLTRRAAVMQVKTLGGLSPPHAAIELNTSIERGWTGLFPSEERNPNAKSNGKTGSGVVQGARRSNTQSRGHQAAERRAAQSAREFEEPKNKPSVPVYDPLADG